MASPVPDRGGAGTDRLAFGVATASHQVEGASYDWYAQIVHAAGLIP